MRDGVAAEGTGEREGEIMSKVHFDANGKGTYHPWNPECGQSGHFFTHVECTRDPGKVTCMRCKTTKAYKEAIKAAEREGAA